MKERSLVPEFSRQFGGFIFKSRKVFAEI